MSSNRLSTIVSRERNHKGILSFTVEVKKSKDYFNAITQRVHVEGDFPENYIVGGEASLTSVPCSRNVSLCSHFMSFEKIPCQVKFVALSHYNFK
jgi:hypothetical protein